MNILLSAFEPFGKENINSTQELIKHLPEIIGVKNITKIILPVVFDECYKKLSYKIQDNEFDYVICLGQNSLTSMINVERVSINIKDARIADNAGTQPIDEVIIKDGPDAYFSRLPIKKMVQASLNANIPAQISNSAGTFVCNNLMYHMLHIFTDKKTRTGFIHIPQTSKQKLTKDSPFMDSKTAANGLIEMIKVL